MNKKLDIKFWLITGSLSFLLVASILALVGVYQMTKDHRIERITKMKKAIEEGEESVKEYHKKRGR